MSKDPALRPLAGRTAVVTGASSGIGHATAVRLAEAGAAVYAAGRSLEGLDGTRAAAEAVGGEVHGVQLDLRQPGSVTELLERALRDTGRLNVLVNNAAVFHPATVIDGSDDQWREMFEVNVFALLEGCRSAVRLMRSAGGPGHIVNIGSLASRLDNGGVYGATKAAVDMLTSSLRDELENDVIRVSRILPGAVATQLGRHFPETMRAGLMERLAEGGYRPGMDTGTPIIAMPDDVARAVVYVVTQPIELNVFEIVVRPAQGVEI